MEPEKNNEEIPFEIALHNLRYDAADIAESVVKAKKKSFLALFVAIVVLAAAGAYPVLTLFHSGKLILFLISLLILAVFAALAYFVTGQIIVGKGRSFFKLNFLHNNWRSAVEDMDTVEEKQLNRQVYDKDIEKAEDRLISACEKLCAEYNKKGKE